MCPFLSKEENTSQLLKKCFLRRKYCIRICQKKRLTLRSFRLCQRILTGTIQGVERPEDNPIRFQNHFTPSARVDFVTLQMYNCFGKTL